MRSGSLARLLPPTLFCFCLPLGVAPAEIALGIWLLAAVAGWVRRRSLPVTSAADAPLLAFVTAALLAALMAPAPGAALREAASLWTLLPFLLAREVPDDARRLRVVLTALLIGALLAAGAGVAGHLARGETSLAMRERIGLPPPELTGGRATGFFSHPMTFAGQQAILLAWFGVAATGGALWPGMGAAWGLPLALLSGGLVLSATRSAVASAALALVAWVGLAPRRRRRAAVALLAVALAVPGLAGGALLARRLARTPEEAPGPGRAAMWDAALEMLRESPLVGVGPGGYRREVADHLESGDYRPAHAHGTLFQVAAECGFLGLSAYLAWWVAWYGAVVRRAVRLRRTTDHRAALIWAAVLAVSVFHLGGIFEYNLGDSEVVMLAAFLAGLPLSRGSAMPRRP